MALIGFRSPLTYHPWPWSEYTEEQKKMFVYHGLISDKLYITSHAKLVADLKGLKQPE